MTESILAYCEPMQADDGVFPGVLKTDAANGGRYIDCQLRQKGLSDAVRGRPCGY